MPDRLILFRPRPEFPLPPEWRERSWIPLGDLRPLLQAVSPVRDLSDIWRWVALPLRAAEVQAALASLTGVDVRWEGERGHPANAEARAVTVYARLIPAALAGEVERVELSDAAGGLLGTPEPEVAATMLAAAAVLRQLCGCLAVGIG